MIRAYTAHKSKKSTISKYSNIYIWAWLRMHDIYRTDKLSTNMGENDVIFFRSDK